MSTRLGSSLQLTLLHLKLLGRPSLKASALCGHRWWVWGTPHPSKMQLCSPWGSWTDRKLRREPRMACPGLASHFCSESFPGLFPPIRTHATGIRRPPQQWGAAVLKRQKQALEERADSPWLSSSHKKCPPPHGHVLKYFTLKSKTEHGDCNCRDVCFEKDPLAAFGLRCL